MSAPRATRRPLHFATVADALAEADRLAAADHCGLLEQRGNWTLGQALGHLATWANFAIDGYPPEVAHLPLLVRVIGRLLRNRVIRGPMMSGMRIGRLPNGTLATDVLPTDEGLRRFRAAYERLAIATPIPSNPAFGPLTHQQWIDLNLRHAELHLGFLAPRDQTAVSSTAAEPAAASVQS